MCTLRQAEAHAGNERSDSPWHALDADTACSRLDSVPDGLSADAAAERLERYGPNILKTERRNGPLIRLLKQFHNVLIYILLAAALLTGLLREWIDMAVILGVVVINAIVGFLQEGKAERAMDAIRGMLSPKATVLRDGEKREVDAGVLVPGDRVLLRAGNKVPADLRVLKVRNAQVDEALLTGESNPVDKQADPVPEDSPLGDRQCMAYAGTVVTGGQLDGIVVGTGADTEIGRISDMVSRVETIKTPLLRRIDAFARRLAMVILALSAIIFLIGYVVLDLPATTIFLSVVGLAVAAIPEGLPAIMTVTLALGVQRMARRNAIVRQLPAVEALGSVTVVCSDKTGTLTRNEMAVAELVFADRHISVSGEGYAPEGQFRLDGEPIAPDSDPDLVAFARACLLSVEARLRRDGGRWMIEGTPTEGSLVVLARKAGLEREDENKSYPRIDALPFESERKFAAALHQAPDGEACIVASGAPERVLELCESAWADGKVQPVDRNAWVKKQDGLADQGLRVIAVARKHTRRDKLQEDDLSGFTLLGLVGIIDPPREEAIQAVKQCREAGITVKMITGDHMRTARKIAEIIGIGDGKNVTEGNALDEADDEARIRLAEDDDVFARSSPAHKLIIMEALQRKGHVVAMTGDGVNDAPALKRADVGIAMGIKGSEASKEAAEIVLADDHFATIERAIEEGRRIYDNLVKTILFLLPTNGAQSLVVIVSVFFLFDTMATTPVQILWVNMVTVITLALALAFEAPEPGIMQRPPRPPQAPILTGFLLWRIGWVSLLIAAAAIGQFLRYRELTDLETARTIAVNTIVSCQIFYLLSSRFFEQSSLTPAGLVGNPKIWIAIGFQVLLQLGFTYVGFAQRLFGTRALQLTQWLWILLAGIIVFLLVELEKALFRYGAARSEVFRPGKKRENERQAQ